MNAFPKERTARYIIRKYDRPWSDSSAEWLFRLQMCVAVREIYFLNFCVWTERKETGRQSGTEFEKEKGGVGGENSARGRFSYEGAACACVYIYACVYLYMCMRLRMEGFSDGRYLSMGAFRDGKISRLTFALSRQLGISVCRIAHRDYRSCVTILGQLRLLIASGSWKKTKTPDRAERRHEKILDRSNTREVHSNLAVRSNSFSNISNVHANARNIWRRFLFKIL